MVLNYELEVRRGGEYHGYIVAEKMNIGLKELGQAPQYSLITMKFKLVAKNQMDMHRAVCSLGISPWLRGIFDNAILISPEEEELFKSVEGTFKIFTVDQLSYSSFGKMLIDIVQGRVESCNCAVDSISFIPN